MFLLLVVVNTHLPCFEALAYGLPHFDELTHVLRLSFKGLLRSDIMSSSDIMFMFLNASEL